VALPRPAATLAILALLGGASACAAPGQTVKEALDRSDLQARLAARGASWVGHGPEPFQVAGERFNADCSGFVEAVYAAEGLSLRRVVQAADPGGTSAVAAAWEAAARHGALWSTGDWPAPGDLVFFHDTWDRNGNGLRDDLLTHLGLVEWVDEDGSVTFLHRIAAGVVRGHLDLEHPGTQRDAAGRERNSVLRVRAAKEQDVPVLAGQLFAGFGRIEFATEPGR
jgi:hypothetical protein